MSRQSPVSRYLPLAYLVLAMGLVATLLPTALRPPPQLPPTSAEFSPDAPPDDSIVLTDLKGGTSATAGGAIAGLAEGPGAAALPQVLQQLKPRKGRCFGSPPRQLESVYAAPCAPAWSGDNGGATWRGVTAEDIKIGFFMNLTGNGEDGEIQDSPPENESAVTRTYRVWEKYFNDNVELYGRKLRFYYIESARNDNDPTTERSAAQRGAEEYKIFAALNETSVPILNELTRRGILAMTLGQMNREFYASRRPYAWSTTPDSTGMVELGAEYLCKKLAHKPPKWTNDPTFDYAKPRVFGMLSYQEGVGYEQNVPGMKRLLKQQCNIELAEAVEYGLDADDTGSDGSAQIATGIARMKAAGVTTIISFQDFLTNPQWANQADAASYFPEWYLPGFGGMDRVDVFFQTYSPTQWNHAFGYSFYEIPERANDSECYRAYHTIDPDNNPDGGMCYYMFAHLVQMFAALQLAGPNLTPASVETGLFKYGYHAPEPPWRMAGGYGPNDYTYPDYVNEIWYDPLADHVNGRKGAYRYINEGRRFKRGEVTTEEPAFFKDPGVTEAPRAPADQN